MQSLTGRIKRYEWGTVDAIPHLLGVPADGRPMAEYWLGTHRLGPASLGESPLDLAIADDPTMIGEEARREFDGQLPFMVKLLSAAQPLSLQVHPNRADAQAGFELENRGQRPLNARERSYKNPWDKPEIIVALTEFETLAGFRDPRESADLISRLGVQHEAESLFAPLRQAQDLAAGLAEVFLECAALNNQRRGVITDVVNCAVRRLDDPSDLGAFCRDVILLNEHFPGDPSLLAAMLLNRHALQPGEALHIRLGTIHAHLRGTGIEVMGNSDNVLRGGLTRKHVDLPGLARVLDFTPQRLALLQPRQQTPGLWHYPTNERAFATWRIEANPDTTIKLPAERSGRIAFVTLGAIEMVGRLGEDGAAPRAGRFHLGRRINPRKWGGSSLSSRRWPRHLRGVGHSPTCPAPTPNCPAPTK